MNVDQIESLVSTLRTASYRHHNGLDSGMTDAEYDQKLEELRQISPEHPFLTEVGAPVLIEDEEGDLVEGEKVTLPFPMPSCNKISDKKAMAPWMSTNPSPYVLVPKFDGISAMWIPKEKKLYTRGNGLIGRDISRYAPYIQGLIGDQEMDIVVRGELILPANSELIGDGEIARNIVAGIFVPDVPTEEAKRVHFIPYEVVQPADLKPTEAMKLLKEKGYKTPDYVVHETISPESIKETFESFESNCGYHIDGVVIRSDTSRPKTFAHEIRTRGVVNPKDMVAWKPIRQIIKTKVTNVEWNVSAYALMKPTIVYEMIEVPGAKMTRVTGHNAKTIVERSIGPGAVIGIRRSGDTIPYLHCVYEPAKPQLPEGVIVKSLDEIGEDNYETAMTWDRCDLRIVDENHPVIGKRRLHKSLKLLEVENIGPSTAAEMYEKGFRELYQIYDSSRAKFEVTLERCGQRKADQIWKGLRVNAHKWNEITFMMASGVFPKLVAESKLKIIMDVLPDFSTWTAESLVEKRLHGISTDTLKKIGERIPKYLRWREMNSILFEIVEEAKQQSPGNAGASAGAAAAALSSMPAVEQVLPSEREVIVFTGVRRPALKAKLEARGHVVSDNIKKETTMVVFGGKKETNTLLEARRRNLKIVTLEEADSL